jgi:hypothetical protein
MGTRWRPFCTNGRNGMTRLSEGEGASDPIDAMIDAAAHSLAIFWPTRPPSMCAVGLLQSDEGPAVKAAAREVVIAALAHLTPRRTG